MPGIVAVMLEASVGVVRETLCRMMAAMVGDPAYATGTHVEADPGVGIGWVAHRGSFADCMPLWNEDRDVGMIVSGEAFVAPADLQRAGVPVGLSRTDDARWLLPMYETMGLRFLEEIDGWHSGVIVDLRKREMTVFNDRLGLGRVYVHERPGGGVLAASEAKAILAVSPGCRRLDAASWGEFFTCGTPLQNRSLFEGVRLLPPGAAWTYSGGRRVRERCHDGRRRLLGLRPLGPVEYRVRLRDALKRVVPRYCGGRQGVALSLTAGLDTRMVLAVKAVRDRALPCYTFGGMYREAEDVRLSRRVAAVCRQAHRVIPLDRDFFRDFGELAARSVWMTDGALDVTGAVSLWMNRIARGITPVRLTGHYGGEVLRGNVVLKHRAVEASHFAPGMVETLRSAKTTYAGERECGTAAFVLWKQVPWHHFARLSIEQTQLTVRSPYLDREMLELAFQVPGDAEMARVAACGVIGELDPALAAVPTDFGWLGSNGVAGWWRRQFQGFIHRAEYAYDYGMPGWLVRIDQGLRAVHPERLILGRHKYYHFRKWYRDELAGTVREILLDPRSLSRPYLATGRLERLVKEHQGGRANHTLAIHQLMTAELIQRQLTEVA